MWTGIKEFFGNYMLISAVLAWFIAQIFKIFTGSFRNQKFSLKWMFANGGMPSSHSACVLALGTACIIQEGVGSPYFAIAARKNSSSVTAAVPKITRFAPFCRRARLPASPA